MRDPADVIIQDAIADHIDALIQAVSTRCEALIAEQLGRVASEGLTVSDALSAYPELMSRYERLLADGRVTASATVQQVFTEMAALNDEWARPYYEATATAQTAAVGHEAMGAVLSDAIARSQAVIDGTLNSSVIGIVDSTGTFIGYGEFARRSVSQAVTGMLAGELSYDVAVGNAVEQMAKSGLRTVATASGERLTVMGERVLKVTGQGGYTSRELYGSIRTQVMDNYRQTLSAMREIQGREFGANGKEISAHLRCAPDHVDYQGQQMSNKEFRDVEARLARPYESWNCKHVVSPIILGISRPAYDSDALDQMRRDSEELVTVTGLGGGEVTKTRYEMTQYQRTIERSMRELDNRRYLLETSGRDASQAAARYRELAGEYRRISREAGLGTREERTRAYVLK